MTDTLCDFREVWNVDFEFRADNGEIPEPHCMVAREWRSGATIRLWADELGALNAAPFNVGADSLFVAYFASAELGCFLSLGWPSPARILDLYVEFACKVSGLSVPLGRGLLGAMSYHGLDGIEATEKTGMRDLAIRGGPFTDTEKAGLLDYCESDVVALTKLLPAMLPTIDVPRALLRGRYMSAVARMEYAGIPVDVDTLNLLREHWTAVKSRLVGAIDRTYGVYIPTAYKLDGRTVLGDAILGAAATYDVDPYSLAGVVDHVHDRDGESDAEHAAAVAEARRRTGLTPNRIAAFERHGNRDYSAWPGLDVTARVVAGDLPALGIGTGHVGGENADDTDYAGRLWELLREPQRKRRKKSDPGVIREAAELLADNPTDRYSTSQPMTFSTERFKGWLVDNDVPWPMLDSGTLALDDSTFRQMAKLYPEVSALRELRHALGELRLESLAVGADGRNRCLLSPFASKTGRNQPSNAKYIFGPSVWLRGLIQPSPGNAVAYVDWSQQEFGIAAALSGDKAMLDAYTSGDPYLTFAKQAGAVPQDATKASHAAAREQFKVCALAVQYGMGEKSLAVSLGQTEAHARRLLQLHRETYPVFWRWSDAAVNHAMLRSVLWTVFGWEVHVGAESNPRSLANFPMQANGADMLRLACCLATERGIRVCAPVHDAVLIEASDRTIEQAVADTQAAMAEASRVVLDGFELRTDAKIVRHPDRYSDPRGESMWEEVMGILADLAFDLSPQDKVSHLRTPHLSDLGTLPVTV